MEGPCQRCSVRVYAVSEPGGHCLNARLLNEVYRGGASQKKKMVVDTSKLSLVVLVSSNSLDTFLGSISTSISFQAQQRGLGRSGEDTKTENLRLHTRRTPDNRSSRKSLKIDSRNGYDFGICVR